MSIFYVGLIPVNFLNEVSQATKEAVENSTLLLYEKAENEQSETKDILLRLKNNNINFSGELVPYGSHLKSENQIYEIEKRVIDVLYSGKNVFITCDDGMPGINDPGSSLLNTISRTSHKIKIIPQVSAIISSYLLSGSAGRNNNRFFFGGILDQYYTDNTIETAIKNKGEVCIYLVNNLHSDIVKNAIKRIYEGVGRVTLCMDIGMETQNIVICDVSEMFEITKERNYNFITIVIVAD